MDVTVNRHPLALFPALNGADVLLYLLAISFQESRGDSEDCSKGSLEDTLSI
jgi:hypothetical protein